MIKTRADLFEAAANMMRMCDEAEIKYAYKYDGKLCEYLSPFIGDICKYEFPIAVVESKPVFEGDEIYHIRDGKVKVRMSKRSNQYLKLDGYNGCEFLISSFSWNPPKPKTMTVELPYEYVKLHAYCLELNTQSDCDITFINACRKALENNVAKTTKTE